jgi:hypothetical protein
MDRLIQAAKQVGCEHGKKKGGFVQGLGLNSKAAKKILEGYEDGDEHIMDLCPSPLSGEWADDPIPMTILDEIANHIDAQYLRGVSLDGDTDDVLDAYESAYREAFWKETIESCKKIAG